MTEKDVCCAHTFRSLDSNFLFVGTLMTPKGKKRINKALSMQSTQLLLFLFFVLKVLTQLKIEF